VSPTPSCSQDGNFGLPLPSAGGVTHTAIPALAYWTFEEIAAASQCPVANVRVSWPLVAAALHKRGLASVLSCIGAIGTIAKETASTFLPVREAYWLSRAAAYAYYADTSKHAAYDGGPEYHGRGFVQTTHRYNYKRVQDITGFPVVAQPDLLLEPEAAAEALAIYWDDRDIHLMCERRDWGAVRRSVLGGADADGVARITRCANMLLPTARV
jgi:hypothetical protein